ncbi:MAG TPA: hypothetical protein PLB78_18685, partial [Anaerolineae bacterium]|nr:hypothetical protein [Anaerolineae bacterium]
FDAVRDIVLFHVENRVMSLATYFKETGQSELPQGQKRTIYYSANTYGVGQHAYLFAERGWRVLDASSYPDEPFLIVYAERFPEAVELVPVDTAGDRVFLELSPKEERWIALEEAFRRNMIEASVVRFEPADIPAVLVDAKDAANLPDDQLERILKADEIAEPVKELFRALKVSRDRWRHTMMTAGAILHLNANSEIIQSLAARSLEDRETTGVMIALYNNALMLSARALTADQAKKIFDGNNSTIKQLMDKSDEIKRLKAAGADPDAIRRLTRQVEDLRQEVDALSARCKKIATERDELAAQLEGERRSVVSLSAQVEKWRSHEAPEPQANYVTCFVMLPFHDDYKGFFEALQRVLETTPYFWQVSRADQEARKKRIDDNVKAWIDQRHCYVAEITDLNGNVMMEVGYAYWRYPERPFLLLCREGRDLHIADLGGAILAVYAWHPDRMDQNVELLRRVIAKQHEFARQQGATHYLSVHSMPPIVVRAMGEAISGRYRTIEQYVQAVDEDVERVLREVPGLTRGLAQDIRDHLVKIAGL